MKFYNRTKEIAKLEELQSESQQHGVFTVLTGVRRVGKTALYEEFSKRQNQPTLYFFVARKEEQLLCQDFADEIRNKLDIFVPSGMTGFVELFQFLLELSKKQPLTLMVDEFQEFGRVNNSIFSEMQNFWDQNKSDSKLNLIVCGSIYSLMMRIFTDAKEPLFGRADYRIHLKPFSTGTLKEILSDNFTSWTNDDLLALYTVTGGIARYVELVVNGQKSQKFSIARLYDTVFSEASFFVEEGNVLLISEFGKQYSVYFSILSCISQGINAQNEIQQRLGGTSIGAQLKHLAETYEVLEKIRPMHAAAQTKKVKYKIRSQFLNFWFRYIDRYRSAVELGNFKQLRDYAYKDYPVFSGFTLEQYFRQKFAETDEYTVIGQWWNASDGQDEVDLIAENEFDKKVVIAEIKRNPSKFQLEKFNEKVEKLTNKYYKKWQVEMQLLSIEEM